MKRIGRFILAALLALSAAPQASAQWKDGEEPLLPDPAWPAIGEWIGAVSWNDPPVSYAWSIYPDGSFTSGRFGRGQAGRGNWGIDGEHLTLKYEDGFRYDGELASDHFSGSAALANGQAFGAFWMRRAGIIKTPIEEAP